MPDDQKFVHLLRLSSDSNDVLPEPSVAMSALQVELKPVLQKNLNAAEQQILDNWTVGFATVIKKTSILIFVIAKH